MSYQSSSIYGADQCNATAVSGRGRTSQQSRFCFHQGKRISSSPGLPGRIWDPSDQKRDPPDRIWDLPGRIRDPKAEYISHPTYYPRDTAGFLAGYKIRQPESGTITHSAVGCRLRMRIAIPARPCTCLYCGVQWSRRTTVCTRYSVACPSNRPTRACRKIKHDILTIILLH